MVKVLFLDIETTGLNPERDLIWQVAYVRAYEKEDTLTLVDAVEFVGKECVKNKIVKVALEWANLLVGHNIAFEKKFLQHRNLPTPETFCTMTALTEVYHKRPKLSEAVEFLGVEKRLKELTKNLVYHDALYDVFAAMLLYCEIKTLKLKADRYRLKTANPKLKYLAVKRYAKVNKWEILESLAGKINLNLDKVL